jgi:hypothetical protein
MIYETVLSVILIVAIVVTIVRMVAQGLFWAVKMDRPFLKGAIPIVSSWKLHKEFGASRLHLIGSLLRVIGVALMLGVILAQYYESLVQLTHMYGLYFQTYTPVDHSVMWAMLSYTGVLMIITGYIIRMFSARDVSVVFNKFGFVNVLFALEPTIYYLWMVFDKNAVFLLNKPTKLMSHEEYQLYCAIRQSE